MAGQIKDTVLAFQVHKILSECDKLSKDVKKLPKPINGKAKLSETLLELRNEERT